MFSKKLLLQVHPQKTYLCQKTGASFFFAIDRTFSLIEVDCKRWPEGMTNSEKLSLTVGDQLTIKCGVGYDDPQLGVYRVQGQEKYLTQIMKQAYNLRMGGHDASKINCLELLEQHVKNDETVGSQVSVQVDPKKKGPKSRKDVELPVEGNQDNDNIPDLPEVDGETVRQILNTAENPGPSGAQNQEPQIWMPDMFEV